MREKTRVVKVAFVDPIFLVEELAQRSLKWKHIVVILTTHSKIIPKEKT
jgi:hypothetical protein